MELIERKAFKEHLCHECPTSYGHCGMEDKCILMRAIDNAPTIDAKPIKKGKWSINDDMWGEPYSIRCSECGEEFVPYEQTLEELANDYKYCPQCGTRNVLSIETETSDNGEDDEND